MLHKQLTGPLLAGLLLTSSAYASWDDSCGPIATLRQNDYTCAGVPVLSPGNDTRVNALLLMSKPGQLAQVFPDPKKVPAEDRPNRLAVPFWYDFSGWIDIGQKSTGDGSSPTDVRSNLYADGEGDICRSMTSGEAAFNTALTAAKDMPADDLTRLRAARQQLQQSCAPSGGQPGWTKPASLKSAVGQQFAIYLDGANAFYRRDFAYATKAFANVSHSTDPWLRETGLYMAGRAQLNAAQDGAIDDTRVNPDQVLKVALNAADTVFHAYLKVYPNGAYAASAAGLQRRVAWIGGNGAQQADLYARAFANWSPETSNVPLGQLANEIDSKLLQRTDIARGQIVEPHVLAVDDLAWMRKSSLDKSSSQKAVMTLDELRAQKPRFAAAPSLHDYLIASWHVYVDHKPEDALALLPQSVDAPLDYFRFSQQTLRGFALEDSGRADEARQLWTKLIPLAKYPLQREALELTLAINLEQAGLVDHVFAEDSPVQNAAVRAMLLQHTASADLLRAQAQNMATSAELRNIALYTLLYKGITHRQYAALITDLALVPAKPSDALKPFTLPASSGDEGYMCPSIRDVALSLQQNATDAKGMNCLAEFLRRYPAVYGLVDESAPVGYVRPANGQEGMSASLGSAPTQFPGKPVERMTLYRAVMADRQASSDDRAYALYRAIRCFAPGGTSECGGNDIPTATRKQWFNTLKASYPGSKWANSLRYYW
ncbi:conserved exported hypothetical protein [Paraburkholderia sabiae]|uniref:hypothetical protein n=1 Tax=Paraburkholderia sabiae TaxID=273251 RepID=UPI001CAB7088|nr:hypothetical protein [Paraburkholderia sabiae]CAG9203201.1 conserved exported hypothetical protein [Paraburkholderia sabiae]